MRRLKRTYNNYVKLTCAFGTLAVITAIFWVGNLSTIELYEFNIGQFIAQNSTLALIAFLSYKLSVYFAEASEYTYRAIRRQHGKRTNIYHLDDYRNESKYHGHRAAR